MRNLNQRTPIQWKGLDPTSRKRRKIAPLYDLILDKLSNKVTYIYIWYIYIYMYICKLYTYNLKILFRPMFSINRLSIGHEYIR